MRVKIYIRSIIKDEKKRLALFDSNRYGDIDDLKTKVKAGDTLIWKLDCCSGIKSITRIYSKEDKHPIFKKDPRKRVLCKGFELHIPDDVEEDIEEKYTIECILYDSTELIIDPYIRVPPPPAR